MNNNNEKIIAITICLAFFLIYGCKEKTGKKEEILPKCLYVASYHKGYTNFCAPSGISITLA
ncbi:MAG: hypothetical protein GY754_24800 [bacterium]|nr:hypothetical protein [bacterium]